MIAGEFNFDDYMYNDNTEANYKLAYFIYILFAVVMTILVTNLLIGKSRKLKSGWQESLFFKCACLTKNWSSFIHPKQALSDHLCLFHV
jgi:hypothetical protein